MPPGRPQLYAHPIGRKDIMRLLDVLVGGPLKTPHTLGAGAAAAVRGPLPGQGRIEAILEAMGQGERRFEENVPVLGPMTQAFREGRGESVHPKADLVADIILGLMQPSPLKAVRNMTRPARRPGVMSMEEVAKRVARKEVQRTVEPRTHTHSAGDLLYPRRYRQNMGLEGPLLPDDEVPDIIEYVRAERGFLKENEARIRDYVQRIDRGAEPSHREWDLAIDDLIDNRVVLAGYARLQGKPLDTYVTRMEGMDDFIAEALVSRVRMMVARGDLRLEEARAILPEFFKVEEHTQDLASLVPEVRDLFPLEMREDFGGSVRAIEEARRATVIHSRAAARSFSRHRKRHNELLERITRRGGMLDEHDARALADAREMAFQAYRDVDQPVIVGTDDIAGIGFDPIEDPQLQRQVGEIIKEDIMRGAFDAEMAEAIAAPSETDLKVALGRFARKPPEGAH